MTLQIWILIIAVFVAVVFLRLGRHRYTRRQRIVSLAVVAVLVLNYVRGMPTTGNDVLLEMACLALGALFGVAMLAVTSVEEDTTTGEVWVRAGIAYLLLWVILLGSRVVFAYSATGWARQDVGHYFIRNHLSFTAITPAFVLMTIGSVGVFAIGLALRAITTSAGRKAPAP
jgi:Flp pilus assembly protein protease CpaA